MSATKIILRQGNGQQVLINSDVDNPLSVLVVDGLNVPVPGVPVTFTFGSFPKYAVGQSFDGIDSVVVNTAQSGLAWAIPTLGDIPGLYEITATASGLTNSPITFSVMAAPSAISLDYAKTYLGIESAASDKLLKLLIRNATGFIEKKINGPTNIQNYPDDIYDGRNRKHLFVRNCPIVSMYNGDLTDVQYRVAPDQDWQDLTNVLEYIELKPEKPYEVYIWDAWFPLGNQNVKVSYRSGYAQIPEPMIQVCVEKVAEMYKESSAKGGIGRLGVQSVGQNEGGVSSTTRYFELSDRHSKLLAPFVYRFLGPPPLEPYTLVTTRRW